MPFDLSGAVDTSGVTVADVIAAGIILLITIAVSMIVGRVTTKRFSRPDTDTLQVARFAGTAARLIVLFIGGAWAVSFLGADVAWLTITVVFVIFIVALIARPLLEKYAAGIAVSTATGFGIGDEIRVKGYEGKVLEFSMRSTVLRLRDGTRVHISNTDMVNQDVVVFTTEQNRRTDFDLEVGGNHTVESVERVVLDALESVEVVTSDPGPRIRARSFGVASVKVSVRIWHKSDLGSASEALDQAVRAIALALNVAGMGLANEQLDVLLSNHRGTPAASNNTNSASIKPDEQSQDEY